MTDAAQLLVVSPDDAVLQAIERCAASMRHSVLPARSVREARRLLTRVGADVACFDSVLPQDELERFWREFALGPSGDAIALLLLAPQSAKLVPATLPAFFQLRRDGLVVKPVRAHEFAREVTRLLAADMSRRRGAALLRAGPVALDAATHQLLFASGGAVGLTATEYRLVRCLMERPGDLVSADELLEEAWGYAEGTAGAELVRAHVSNVRRKLREAGFEPQLLRNVPYQGYGFAVEAAGPLRAARRRPRHSK